MASWKILSNYKTFGLGFAVECVIKAIRKGCKLSKVTIRKMALVIVRTSLVAAINDRSFYAA